MREPPFRLLSRALVRSFSSDLGRLGQWDAVGRPEYLMGVLRAVKEAVRQGERAICVAEFGVAGGNGLVALEEYAARAERASGVTIEVIGFDTGAGLPSFALDDYREHPDLWGPGDFAMDEQKLRARLKPRTQLVLGDVAKTVPEFVTRQRAPIGFAAIDVDLYSATAAALRILSEPNARTLNRVALYFDDVNDVTRHRFAGELLAIDEFNEQNQAIRIDRWRGIEVGRPFPEAAWLEKMYVAHNLQLIAAARPGSSRGKELQLSEA